MSNIASFRLKSEGIMNHISVPVGGSKNKDLFFKRLEGPNNETILARSGSSEEKSFNVTAYLIG